MSTLYELSLLAALEHRPVVDYSHRVARDMSDLRMIDKVTISWPDRAAHGPP